MLETHKADLRHTARIQLLSTRFTSLWTARRRLSNDVDGDIIPPPRQFAFLPEIRAIIDAPDDVLVDESSFEVLRPSISSIVHRWISNKRTLLEKKINSQCAANPLNLDLVFDVGLYCTVCTGTKSLSYPSVLFHACPERGTHDGVDAYETAFFRSSYKDLEEYRHRYDFKSLCVKAERLRSIVLACGQDPSRVTPSQMDALDTRLTCANCHDKGHLIVMNWRAAVSPHWHTLRLSRRRYLFGILTGRRLRNVGSSWVLS